jgi:TPP-dependent pyruvate/acetoin dehydrogenase alpha subunit
LTNEQFDLLDKRAKETVLAAVKFAEKSPQPPLDTLYDYTYANGTAAAGASPGKSNDDEVDTAATIQMRR